MKLKKLLNRSFALVAIIAVSLTTILLTVITDIYMENQRQSNLEQTVSILKSALVDQNGQPIIQNKTGYDRIFTNLVKPPIVGLSYRKADGTILSNQFFSKIFPPPQDSMLPSGVSSSHMDTDDTFKQMIDSQYKPGEIKTVIIDINNSDGTLFAQLYLKVIQFKSMSIIKRLTQSALYISFGIAMVVVLLISLILSIIFSRFITIPLEETAKQAGDLLLDIKQVPAPSKIDEVATIRESLNNLDSRLRLKRKSRKLLLDELVHQSRTPLTVMRTHLEAIEDGIVDMDSKEIELLYKEIESLTLMISNMSSMISASNEKEPLQIKEFSLEKRLHTIESGLRPQFEKKQITFIHDIQEGIVMHSDPNLLSQIVYNILTNAQKYTEEGGTVSLGSKEEDGTVFVWVKDNGIGMSEETRSHVCEAYYRSPDVVSLKGEGIGLYLVKQQLDRLKGHVTIDSKLHKGSTFTLSFPKDLQENK